MKTLHVDVQKQKFFAKSLEIKQFLNKCDKSLSQTISFEDYAMFVL